jgi:hypothetical protein
MATFAKRWRGNNCQAASRAARSQCNRKETHESEGRDGGIREELAAGMIKKRRTYLPRIVGDKVMMPADLKRLHKYMLDIEHIDHISDEMRAVVEQEWPELAHKLPPRA